LNIKMAGREEYLLEQIAGEYQKQLIVGTDAKTGLKAKGIQFRSAGATFAVLKVDDEDALSGMFEDLDNSISLDNTDGVLFAGKDKFFTDVTLKNATDSIWLLMTKDA